MVNMSTAIIRGDEVEATSQKQRHMLLETCWHLITAIDRGPSVSQLTLLGPENHPTKCPPEMTFRYAGEVAPNMH